ncbi:MAG: hypothetical protein ACE5F1_06630 [Planctomycetota bacterium]
MSIRALPLLVIAALAVGAGPRPVWDGKHSRRLPFERALSITKDPSMPLNMCHSAWARIMTLCEDGFLALHALERRRPAFLQEVRAALHRLSALLNEQRLAQRPRPNRLSHAEALAGISDPRSTAAELRACLDLLVFDIEVATRGLQARLQKGGEIRLVSAIILSWFRRFLEGR